MPSLVKIGPAALKTKILICRQFLLFRYYLNLEKGMALYLNILESLSPKGALNQFWLKLAQWFWIRRFLNFVFGCFVIISYWKSAWPFI